MSFEHDWFIDKRIRRVIHVGADRGGEITQYLELGVEEVIWIEANPEVYGEMQVNLALLDSNGKIRSRTFNRAGANRDASDRH